MCNPAFRIALETGADFSDYGMTIVYRISDYVFLKRMGLPAPGIVVEDALDPEGGWLVTEEDLMAFMQENDISPDWMKEGV